MMIYAPVMIPTLNRYDHFKLCLESLSRCTLADKTEVYIALDYPPAEKYKEGYHKIKSYLETCGNLTFKQLHIIKRDKNYGVIQNFRQMQLELFSKYDRIICSDDDLEFAPNFLEYMDKCLEKYENDPDVAAISAYAYPIKWKVSQGATCLKQNVSASDWGIGYWRDKYNQMYDYLYNNNLKKSLRKVIREKSYLGMMDAGKSEYFGHACSFRFKDKDQDYWRLGADFAMRAYIALEHKYFVSPVITKTKNYGFDGSGAVCGAITEFGDTAATYNYPEQPIDTLQTFSLVEDTINEFLANRDILNSFDSRKPEQMVFTNKLIWLCTHLGCWSAHIYGRAHQSKDICKMLMNRIFHS